MRSRVLGSVAASAAVLAALLTGCRGDSPTEPHKKEPAGTPKTGAPPSLATATHEAGMTITTDKDDYAPGDTVWFTGTGWPANDTLDIVLTDDPATHDPHKWPIPTRADGTFRDSTYVVDVGDVGVTFTLTATSRATGKSLAVQFTDAELVTAELTVPVNDVTVTQGTTANFTISLSATGAIKCVATAGNPATARVHTVFSISAAGVVSSSTPSGAFNFFGGTSVGGPNCSVAWTGAPAPYTAAAAVSAASGTPVGNYTVMLSPGAGTVSLTNPSGMGANLDDNTATAITVHVVAGNMAPAAPANLAQFKTNGTTPISVGGFTNETAVVLKGTVADPDAGNTVKLQVEVRPVGTPFSNTMTGESDLLPSGSTASVTVMGLLDGTSYHWQARTMDNNGATSSWVSFGGNGDGDADFRVDVTPPSVTINQAAGQADPTNASPINFTVVFSEPVSDFATGDVTLGGTAGASSAIVTGSGSTYNVAVSGMTTDGVVSATIAAGVAHDAAGNTNVASGSTDNTVTYDRTPPVVSAVQASPNPSNGVGNVVLTATATDALSKVASAEYSIDGGGFSAMAAQDGAFDELAEDVRATISVGALSEGSHALCVRATDRATNSSGDTAACTTLIVDRTPPVISAFTVLPNPVAVNTPFAISATFTDALTTVANGEYSLSGSSGPWYPLPAVSPPYGSQSEQGSLMLSVANADVMDLCVRSTDQVGNTNQASGTNPIPCILVAVYDPAAGFVTGGGWIWSPEGACLYAACGYQTTGKATFGFVSKYQKGATVPTGNTEFQFQAGNLNFKSTSYDWLVVSQNGTRAQYKGYGSVNGQSGYGFLLTAIDQTTDQFRIKIWDTATGNIVYDNRLGSADSGNDATPLGGGSIIIHVPKTS